MSSDVSTSHTLGKVDCTNEQYHTGPGISKSHLGVMATCPAIYWQNYVNPERESRKATPAMEVGTAIHAAILEPHVFADKFIVRPGEWDMRKKDDKAKLAELQEYAQAEGCTVITEEQYTIAAGCAKAVQQHPRAARMLAKGSAEQTYYALHQDEGALVKCRFDWEAPGLLDLDVKSCEDASPDGFMRSVMKYHYHAQVAWYQDVRAAALDDYTVVPWWFLAIEKSPPYCIGLYDLEPDLIKAGRLWANEQLRKIVRCRASNVWPDYGHSPQTLTAPGWMRKRLGLDSPEMEFA